MNRVVYQGTRGSFSEEAARAFWGEEVICTGRESFRELYEAIQAHEAEIAVIPIENTLIGSIWENEDLLKEWDVAVVGEKTLRIEHCLMGVEVANVEGEERIKMLKRVLSHPKALDQCRAFFKKHPWILPIVHYDTAGAAEQIMRKGDVQEGAIASDRTAVLYDLHLIQRGVEDHPHNFTRFLFIAKKGNNGGDKCSLIFVLKHESGSLLSALEPLKGMNMTKIGSRPLVGKPFEYLFHMDIEFPGEKKETVEKILVELRSRALFFKNLGFYAREER